MKQSVREILEVLGHWAWGYKATEMSSDPFPRVGEDDLWSFPELDLHLTIKTEP